MDRLLPWVASGSTFPREFIMIAVATALNAVCVGALAFGVTAGVLIAFRVLS